ncbi:MAG: DEAD/DEAH box helicase, partial [Bowdeniella nasicola]|nr:DEAD/DEAH box helicase [Bowdeniella nasicola]
MTALLPTRQTAQLVAGLTDYLATTFALSDESAQSAIEDFLKHRDTGMFKGPFVRLRLPYSPSDEDAALQYLPSGFIPYHHQARAFARLKTRPNLGETDREFRRPEPTIVTTGTGSGKTEAFLYPILDHVLRAQAAGITGTKALILYPMNALANDQANRLAKLITSEPKLHGVRAALYTGEGDPNGPRQVTPDSLISNRQDIRDNPPDIILTNYKMLDIMLLRGEDRGIWERSALSLQYLVLDEFHTYDGAQGTDVAMLLRRLGLTLKSWWPEDLSTLHFG